jgi:protein-tyrosine phosphatase
MRPTLYTVAFDGPGTLSIMAKPEGGTWLADQMAGLREAGVDILLSALGESEQVEAELINEPLEAAYAGLRFISLPVPDMGLPITEDVLPALRELADDLAAGQHVAIHCWAGIGRSSVLAAALMVLAGSTPADAIARISDARGCPVPETPAQRDWIFTLQQLP